MTSKLSKFGFPTSSTGRGNILQPSMSYRFKVVPRINDEEAIDQFTTNIEDIKVKQVGKLTSITVTVRETVKGLTGPVVSYIVKNGIPLKLQAMGSNNDDVLYSVLYSPVGGEYKMEYEYSYKDSGYVVYKITHETMNADYNIK